MSQFFNTSLFINATDRGMKVCQHSHFFSSIDRYSNCAEADLLINSFQRISSHLAIFFLISKCTSH